MNIDKLLPYRITSEQIEDLEDSLFRNTLLNVNRLGRISTTLFYIELESGCRFSMKTIWGPKIYELKELQRTCINFVEKINIELNKYEKVFHRNPWKIHYIHPTHLDPYTLDYLETPTKGYWILSGEFRGITKEDLDEAGISND